MGVFFSGEKPGQYFTSRTAASRVENPQEAQESERDVDFLEWVTGNPARITDVASFAKLREPPFESTWDVISQ